MTNPASQTAEPAALPERPYAASVTAVLRELRVEPASGLSAQEAARRLKRYGPNELLTHPPTTADTDPRQSTEGAGGLAARHGGGRRRAFRGVG